MDIQEINKRLKDIHGQDLLGQAIYRCIWSDDEIEKRFGLFKDFVPGTNIFLREVKEVREVKKYSYLEPQWVLEKLFVNHHNKEILDNSTFAPASCTYEPLWSFGHELNGRAKRPVWRAIELILMSVNNPEKLTPSQMSDEEKKQAYKDELLMRKYIDENTPNDSLHEAVKDGGAVMFGRSTSEMK